MKPSRLAFAAAFGFLVFLVPANSCGPFFPEAVFVQNSMPDGPYAAYAKGEIGVPQPGYRVQDLVIAYDWLNGHGLSAGEQQQAVALDRAHSGQGYEDPAKLPGFTAWVTARKDSGVPEPPAPPAQPGFHITQDLNSDRPVPGASYQNFANCLDEAFAFAASTLKDRKTAHANDPTSLTDWVQGQDAVFANCNGSGDNMPADAPATAPAWLKQDRAYQQAAAKFYQTDYDGAIDRLKTIAADTSSPWHQIARLVEARAMIRRATIGQITDIPAAAIETPNAPYSEDRTKAQSAYADLVRQKEPQRLAEARDALQAILADTRMQPYHADATGLLDFVNLRLDPAAQADVLVARLTAPDRAQTPGRFQQALIDLRYYLYPPDSINASASDTNKKPAWPAGSGSPYDTGPRSPALPPLFFNTTPATPVELPDPPFLTAADRTATDREIAALLTTPCSSDYFATAALDWQKQHPADPRTITLLGCAERAVRNGCRTKATPDLNHRLFVIVQTRYPKSEWAKKYTTWE